MRMNQLTMRFLSPSELSAWLANWDNTHAIPQASLSPFSPIVVGRCKFSALGLWIATIAVSLFAFPAFQLSNAQDIAASGTLYSTTFSPSGVPTSKAVHPFTISFRGQQWSFNWSDEAVLNGTKMGPESVEAAFDGTHLFTKIFYTKEMQQRMQNDPTLQSVVQKNPVLSQAKAKFDLAMKNNNPLLRPMNTNSESGYVDKTHYPKRLAFAGRTLWLGLISCREVKESTFALGDIFDSSGKSNWKAARDSSGQLTLVTTNRTAGKVTELAPGLLQFDGSTNMLGNEYFTGFRLVKYFPGHFKGPTPVFHECRVSNLVYSAKAPTGDMMPKFVGLAFVEDHRFGSGAVRYVSSNGAFMTPNTTETKTTLQEISKNQVARRRLKPMSPTVAVLWAATVFVPLFLIAKAVRRASGNKKTS